MSKKDELNIEQVSFDENGEVTGLTAEQLDDISGGVLDSNKNCGTNCGCKASN